MLYIAQAILRASLQMLRGSRPRDSWSTQQTFLVLMLRELLLSLVDAPPEVQRRVLSEPSARTPADIEESQDTLAGRAAFRWSPKGCDSDAVILHFHGGGYVVGHPVESRLFLGALVRAAGVPAISLDYRLCPEHPHPAAQEDGVAAVLELVERGIAAERIVLAGDSAGGGLALGVLRLLREQGGPVVAGAVLGSPMVNLAATAPSYEENAGSDYLVREMVLRWSRETAKDFSDPTISLRHADLSGLPPLRFLVGEAELFRDDVLACAQAAERAGVDVQTILGEDAVHCWYKIPQAPGPGGRIATVADLVRGLLGETTAYSAGVS